MKPCPKPPAGTPRALARTARAARPALAALTALLAWAPAPVPAQALRDPTRAPEVVATVAPPGSSTPAAPRALRQLLVVDGRRYVVDGSRLRGVGDTLGAARIERIEDAAIVVRDAGGTHRLPLHAGVSKRPAPQAGSAEPNSR